MELTDIIKKSVNSKFKDRTVADFLSEEKGKGKWLSTGSALLNATASNRKDGGYAIGTMVLLDSLEGGGKSLLCLHAVAETQKVGGVAVYIDTENAINEKTIEFAEAIGVDINKMLLLQNIDTLEDVFTVIEDILDKAQENQSKLVTIILDSHSAITPKNEFEGDFKKEGWNTDKALVTGKAFRKITYKLKKSNAVLIVTRQLRMKLDAGLFGDPYTASGGLANDFHASLRLRLAKSTKIKAKIYKTEEEIGMITRVKVTKSRFGSQGKVIKYTVYYDRGIDDINDWIEVLKEHEQLKQGGGWWTWIDMEKKDEEGNPLEHKFRGKNLETLITVEQPHLKKQMYDILHEVICRSYSTKNIDKDDMFLDQSDIEQLDIDEIAEKASKKEIKE